MKYVRIYEDELERFVDNEYKLERYEKALRGAVADFDDILQGAEDPDERKLIRKARNVAREVLGCSGRPEKETG